MARQTFTCQNLEIFAAQTAEYPPYGHPRGEPDLIGLVFEVTIVLGDYEKLNGISPEARLVLGFLLCLMGPLEASRAVEYLKETQEAGREIPQSILDYAHPFTHVN